MRLFNTALALLVLTAGTAADAADDATTTGETQAGFDAERKSNNSANDPTEPRLTLEYWNYYAPSLNNLNGGAENGEGRILIPFQINGVQQLFHIDPPIVTNPTAKTGPRTGLGDTQIYNLTLIKRDVGLYEHEPITFGASDRSSRLRQTPAPISAQTACRLVPQAPSSRPSLGVFLGCWGPISARCRGPALS
jgi:hypothetical protein